LRYQKAILNISKTTLLKSEINLFKDLTTKDIMEQSDNTHNTESETLTNAEFQKLAEIFLDFYKEGKYSLEGIELGESTHSQRKSIKNDFKDHIFGDAKFRKINGKDAKKRIPKYTMCIFRACLEAETKRIIEVKRKYREVKKELDELKNVSPIVRQNEIDSEVRRLLPIKVEERIKEKIELAERMNSRIPKYQATIDKQNQEIEILKERLENSVERNELLDAHAETLQYKELYFKAKAKADKVEVKDAEKEAREKAKAEAKAEAERQKKLEQIKKLQDELESIS